jgi:hypothetical protein
MPLMNIPLEAITQEHLLTLIEDQVPEGKTIDYKQALPGNSYADKREFLADGSSFANAAGGHLVFGVKEQGGVPVELCGLQGINADEEINRLESSIRDGIKPRIPGLVLRPVPLHNGGIAVVVRIPRSWALPHVVDFQGHWRAIPLASTRSISGKYGPPLPSPRQPPTGSGISALNAWACWSRERRLSRWMKGQRWSCTSFPSMRSTQPLNSTWLR